MKKIVRGNDFTLRIPVRKIIAGKQERFPLPGCTHVQVNLVNAFRRVPLEFTISASDDSLIEASVVSSKIGLGSYSLEVKGRLHGCAWRSNEYEQICFVDHNAAADTEFEDLLQGEGSVEMDTAIAIMPPTVELGQLIDSAAQATSAADAATARANAAAVNADKATAETKEATDRANQAAERATQAAERAEAIDINIDNSTGELVLHTLSV